VQGVGYRVKDKGQRDKVEKQAPGVGLQAPG